MPADAVAVAINLTAVDATAPTYVTAWPGGQARPTTSNLNPVPGMAVPNLAIIRFGSAGDVNFFNNSGTVNLLADVVGYFRDGTSVGLAPLVPARLLDTRDGTGGRLGALGQGQSMDLQIAGRGGVSTSPEAVALNVTVTGPTAGSFLTVWPSGEPRPFASSVNMVAGQTVPNMVLARVGANGMISIFNNSGSTDVVVDVLGCFDGDAQGRYVALGPRRVLDTREGLGSALAPVGQVPLEVVLLGKGGVPSQGVSGVMLNVTAVTPTANTYVTVYPGGSDRPMASNLNVSAGQVIPNMVLARVGPEWHGDDVQQQRRRRSRRRRGGLLHRLRPARRTGSAAVAGHRVRCPRDSSQEWSARGFDQDIPRRVVLGHDRRSGADSALATHGKSRPPGDGEPTGSRGEQRIERDSAVAGRPAEGDDRDRHGRESRCRTCPTPVQQGGSVAQRPGTVARHERLACRSKRLDPPRPSASGPPGWAANTPPRSVRERSGSVTAMVDEGRRGRLLAMKLTALVRDHGAGTDLLTAPFALGAAATDGGVGWVLLDERQQRGLGPALAWAVRAGVTHLHVLAEEGTGTIARRAPSFRLPIEVWHVTERVLLPAIAEPLAVPPSASPDHEQFRALITQGGAVPAIENGVLVGEVRGLEVCRVVTDRYTGVARLEVGLGQHDREAFQMLHGNVPTVEALAKVVAAVAPHRQHGADPHPLNRLGQEQALRARLIDDPAMIGATEVDAIPSPVVRPNLKDPYPCVARAVVDGSAMTVVVSAGVDLDLVPFATDARLATGDPTMIVLPKRDVVPVQVDIAALLAEPMQVVPVS